jgi:IclR family acetate operon transcriptional repressor
VPVKSIRSAARVLAVLEAIAEQQPIGVGALARLLDDDKSAVQRALVTLHNTGWIRPMNGEPTRWVVTTQLLVVSQGALRRSGLRSRVRPTLRALRDETGETVLLAVADAGRIVTIDTVASHNLTRTVPYVGMVLPTEASASGQAILAQLTDREVATFLGAPPGPKLRAELAQVRERSWSHNHGDASEGVAAAILDADGRPIAAIAISAPAARMPAAVQRRFGERVAHAAAMLSSDTPDADDD